MKHTICNIKLLPKAADLRKKVFDEFRLNTVIVLLKCNLPVQFLSPRSQGLASSRVTPEAEARRPEGTDYKKSDGFYFILF